MIHKLVIHFTVVRDPLVEFAKKKAKVETSCAICGHKVELILNPGDLDDPHMAPTLESISAVSEG